MGRRSSSSERRREGSNSTATHLGAALIGAVSVAIMGGVAWFASRSSSSSSSRVRGGGDTVNVDTVRPAAHGEKECVICFSNRVDCCLKPCNHVLLCQSCALRVEQCPSCRAEIHTRDGPLYIS